VGMLDGRTAVVTAAGSGMGRASAQRFAAEGAYVVVVDIDGKAAEETVAGITGAGGTAEHAVVDVSSVAGLRQLFDSIKRRLGTINVLYNHAGLAGPAGMDISEDEYDRTVEVNLKSAFFASSLAIPLLRLTAPHASIIFTSSISGLASSPASPLYGMTKGGLIILMRSMAKQLGPSGIRVNAICPGPIDTPMLRVFTDPVRRGLEGEAAEAQLAARRNAIPLRRLGSPDDVAAAALFLASDQSSFITGVALPVDGGMMA
jgi:NAD(P)-dependent dehydrogenase (short-subunit alcohol dehydrogenase family)